MAWAWPGCMCAGLLHQDACVSVPGLPPASPRKRVLLPQNFPLLKDASEPSAYEALLLEAPFCLLQAAVCLFPRKQRCPHWACRPQLSASVGASFHKLSGSSRPGLGQMCAFHLVPLYGRGRVRRDSLSCNFPRPGFARHHVRETRCLPGVKGTVRMEMVCGLCGRPAAMQPCQSRTRPRHPHGSIGSVSPSKAPSWRPACRMALAPPSVLLLHRVCLRPVRETGATCTVRVLSS